MHVTQTIVNALDREGQRLFGEIASEKRGLGEFLTQKVPELLVRDYGLSEEKAGQLGTWLNGIVASDMDRILSATSERQAVLAAYHAARQELGESQSA